MTSEESTLREDLGIGQLFELVPDAVIVGDARSGRITLWNDGARDLFGYSEHEAIGMEMAELVPPEFREAHRLGLSRYAAEGPGRLATTREIVELPAVHRDGRTVWVELRLAPIGRTEAPQYAIAVLRDVTSRRAAQLEAAEQTARAEAAAVSMREFVGMASHDLRNPISAITAAAGLLARRWDSLEQGQRQHVLDVLDRQTAVVLALLDDLLDVTRIEAGQLAVAAERIDITSSVEAAIAATGSSAETQFATPADQTIFADPQHLHRVLVNLLSNADKYGAPPITVVVELVDAMVAVHVDDGGAGVPENLRARLFEKFARAEHGPDGPTGTGLGLAIVHGLTKANRGRVSYLPRPAGGSRFTTVWPVDAGRESVRLPVQQDGPQDAD